MIRLTLQILTGLVLCGCTVNNFHSTVTTSFDQHSTEFFTSEESFKEQRETSTSTSASTNTSGVNASTDTAEITADKNIRVKPDCGIYVPLPVPKPIKIDFKELETAKTSKEINAIALRNVKELHLQLNAYSVRQHKHYNDYLQRCASK